MKSIVKISTLAVVLMTSGLTMATATPAMAGETKTRTQAQLVIKKPGRVAIPGKINPNGGAQHAGTNNGNNGTGGSGGNGGNGSGYPGGNVATAWTAACYAEFGPGAKNPNAAALDYCLSY